MEFIKRAIVKLSNRIQIYESTKTTNQQIQNLTGFSFSSSYDFKAHLINFLMQSFGSQKKHNFNSKHFKIINLNI